MSNESKESISSGSDEAFYQLAKLCGPALLKLAGVEAAEEYPFRVEVLKQKEMRPDLSAVPLERGRERIFVEFQGYRDPWVLYRLAMSILMATQAEEQEPDSVRALVVYTESGFQKVARRLLLLDSSSEPTLLGCFDEVVLTDYSEERLLAIDPRLVPLAPYTLPKQTPLSDLGLHCQRWIGQIQNAFEPERRNDVVDVLALFLINRFQNLSVEEVWTMLNLDLHQTRAGRQLYQEGRTEGFTEGQRALVIKTIAERFGACPSDIAATVNNVDDHTRLERLFIQLLHCDNLDAVRAALSG